jgi:hypothetical protein
MTSFSAPEGNRPPGSFVDREREFADLRAGLTYATAGQSHLFSLSGEPGIGETGLADEFGRMAVAQGVPVAWGRCWEGEGARPHIGRGSRSCALALDDTDADQRAAILGSEAAPNAARDIGQFPELRAGHLTPRPPGPRPANPEQARFQFFESLATLLPDPESPHFFGRVSL